MGINQCKLSDGNGTTVFSLFVLILLLCSATVHSQQVMTFTAESGEMFMLPELGAIVVPSDDGLKVDMVMPPDHRPEQYKSVDLQVGDIIKMFNGKSMKDVPSCEEIYNTVAVGDDVKLGIKRGRDTMIIKFPKADAKDMPGTMKIEMSGGDDNGGIMADFATVGLLLNVDNGVITIADVIEEIGIKYDGEQPQTGDRIIKLDKNDIASMLDLKGNYETIKPGDKVKLTVQRGDDEFVFFFVKPEPGEVKPLRIMKKTMGN